MFFKFFNNDDEKFNKNTTVNLLEFWNIFYNINLSINQLILFSHYFLILNEFVRKGIESFA